MFSWSCRSAVVLWGTSRHARLDIIMILKVTATFQVLFIVSLFCAWNITTVKINSGVHLLKGEIGEVPLFISGGLGLGLVILVLGLKNFVLFTSLLYYVGMCSSVFLTPLRKHNRGVGIVCTKPRTTNVYDFIGLVFLSRCLIVYLSCSPALRNIFHTPVA